MSIFLNYGLQSLSTAVSGMLAQCIAACPQPTLARGVQNCYQTGKRSCASQDCCVVAEFVLFASGSMIYEKTPNAKRGPDSRPF